MICVQDAENAPKPRGPDYTAEQDVDDQRPYLHVRAFLCFGHSNLCCLYVSACRWLCEIQFNCIVLSVVVLKGI